MNTSRHPLQITVLLVKVICAQCRAPDCGAAVNHARGPRRRFVVQTLIRRSRRSAIWTCSSSGAVSSTRCSKSPNSGMRCLKSMAQPDANHRREAHDGARLATRSLRSGHSPFGRLGGGGAPAPPARGPSESEQRMTPPPTLLDPEGARDTCPGYLDDPPEVQRVINEAAGFWIGCEHPERPVDAFMVTIAGCRGCEIAHEAADRRGRLTVDVFHQRPDTDRARGSPFGPDIGVL